MGERTHGLSTQHVSSVSLLLKAGMVILQMGILRPCEGNCLSLLLTLLNPHFFFGLGAPRIGGEYSHASSSGRHHKATGMSTQA